MSMSFQVSFPRNATIDRIGFELRVLRRARLAVLSRSYEWIHPDSIIPYTVDSLTPGLVSILADDLAVHVRVRNHAALQVDTKQRTLRAFLDLATTHPRIVFTSRGVRPRSNLEYRPGDVLSMEIGFLAVPPGSEEQPGPVLWRYPQGRKSCFVITDHADWDDAEKVQAMFFSPHGIASTHIKITKSVFFRSKGFESPSKTYIPAAIDDDAYLRTIQKLRDDGHEICPHSVVPSIPAQEVPLSLLKETLEFFAQEFGATTWIDHGVYGQLFNYSLQGWDRGSQWYALDLLREYGFCNLWSYVDLSRYPVHHINQLGEGDTPWAHVLAAGRGLGAGQPWRAAVHMRMGTALWLGEDAEEELQHALAPLRALAIPGLTGRARLGALSKWRRSTVALGHLIANAKPGGERARESTYAVLYPESGPTLGQHTLNDFVLFSTICVNNWGTAYRNLRTLVRARGIHLAHTYLCNDLPYTDHVVDRVGSQIVPTKAFVSTLELLSSMVTNRDVWNPTLAELAQWFRVWSKVRVQQWSDGQAIVENLSAQPIRELTLLFPPGTRHVSASCQEVTTAGTLSLPLFVLTLKPRAATIVRWR